MFSTTFETMLVKPAELRLFLAVSNFCPMRFVGIVAVSAVVSSPFPPPPPSMLVAIMVTTTNTATTDRPARMYFQASERLFSGSGPLSPPPGPPKPARS